MKNKTLVQCVMLALVCVSGLLHISSASSSSVLATTAEPTTAATKAGTVEAATATSTKLSTEHMLYRTTDRTCELAIADLNGQNAICVARNLVSDMVAAAQKAWAIDPQDKTVKTSTHLDADLFADGSKVIVRTRAYFDRGDSASLINVFRYYLVDLAAGSSKVFVDGTDTKTRLPIQADVRIATDGMRVAYTDRTSLFIDALDGNPPRQVAEDGLFLHFAAIAWSPDGKQILVAEFNRLLLFDATLTKGKPLTLNTLPVGEYYGAIAWSPDGKQALIRSGNEQGYLLYLYRFADKTPVKFIPANLPPNSAFFSPDGQKVIFVTLKPYNLYTINVDGSGLQLVATPNGLCWGQYGFAPDGSHILYTSNDSIYLANTDGSNARAIV